MMQKNATWGRCPHPGCTQYETVAIGPGQWAFCNVHGFRWVIPGRVAPKIPTKEEAQLVRRVLDYRVIGAGL